MIATCGLSLAGSADLARGFSSPINPGGGQLEIAQGTDPIGGSRLQEHVSVRWRDEGDEDC